MTDAPHGWRKNSKDTSVVALEEQTHKVMDCVHITKSQDKVAQTQKTWYSKNVWTCGEQKCFNKDSFTRQKYSSQQICEGNTVHNKSKICGMLLRLLKNLFQKFQKE